MVESQYGDCLSWFGNQYFVYKKRDIETSFDRI